MTTEYRVTLKGTWVRERTHSSELTMVRRLSYRVNRGDGGMGTAVERLTFKATQDKVDENGNLATRCGTFEVAVVVKAEAYLNQTRVEARAKRLLTWAMQDAFCRSPKLSIDSISRYRRTWS